MLVMGYVILLTIIVLTVVFLFISLLVNHVLCFSLWLQLFLLFLVDY